MKPVADEIIALGNGAVERIAEVSDVANGVALAEKGVDERVDDGGLDIIVDHATLGRTAAPLETDVLERAGNVRGKVHLVARLAQALHRVDLYLAVDRHLGTEVFQVDAYCVV